MSRNKKRLGFTWWPKDWASSQKVQSMNIIERGIYRELIDLVMDAEEAIKLNKTLWTRLWRIDEDQISAALDYLEELGAIELHGDKLWIPSCENRLGETMKKRDSARENGAKGGRPPKEVNNPEETQKKPNGFTTETEKKTTTKTETTTETESEISPTPDLNFENIVLAVDQLSKQKIWYEQTAINTELTAYQMDELLKQFPGHCITQGKTYNEIKNDLRGYFAAFARMRKNVGNLPPKEPKGDVKNWLYDEFKE